MKLGDTTKTGSVVLVVDDENQVLFWRKVPIAAVVRGIVYKISHRGGTRFTVYQRHRMSMAITWWIKYRLGKDRRMAIPKPPEWFEDLSLKFKPTIGATPEEYAVLDTR